jgi:ribosomal protein S18 acetylase RimI-like enzyme
MPIRSATPADIPAILPMVRAICSMHERLVPARYAMLPDVVDRYARWLPERAVDPRSVFLVAESDGSRPALIGFLIATIESSVPIYVTAAYGFIHDVWVEPESRGRGTARALVDAAVRRFTQLGVSQVRLETAAANEPARALFAALGFRTATIDMLRELTDLSGPPASL